MQPGVLILVVGPSGAGKDTMLDAARRALAARSRFHFARRVVTRPVDAGGEDHEPATEAEFATRAFALQWQAHGMRYGIPTTIADELAGGQVVVANVSRTVLADAARRFPARAILVTAPAAVLADRLAARGREAAAAIAARLAREVPLPPGLPVEIVLNDATPEIGAARFLAALSRAAAAGPPDRTAPPAPPG
jgi:phosphonate metabolism protein PhnN/1,5-bisphosphokinase (PRPP-forming)